LSIIHPLIERIEVSVDQIEIRLRLRQLNALLDVAAAPIQGVIDDETEILSLPVRLRRRRSPGHRNIRRAGRELLLSRYTEPNPSSTYC
jgi:hypothetical protein